MSNLYGWEMSQKLPVYDFKWVEEICEFDESFIKSYSEESDEEYFLELDIHCLENLHNLHNDLLFLQERMKYGKIYAYGIFITGGTEFSKSPAGYW